MKPSGTAPKKNARCRRPNKISRHVMPLCCHNLPHTLCIFVHLCACVFTCLNPSQSVSWYFLMFDLSTVSWWLATHSCTHLMGCANLSWHQYSTWCVTWQQSLQSGDQDEHGIVPPAAICAMRPAAQTCCHCIAPLRLGVVGCHPCVLCVSLPLLWLPWVLALSPFVL